MPSLVGVDFSPVAAEQAAHRAALFGLTGRTRFVVGDLTQHRAPGRGRRRRHLRSTPSTSPPTRPPPRPRRAGSFAPAGGWS